MTSIWKKYIFKNFANFKYGKMPNKSKVTDNGKYPVYSGYRYVGRYNEYNIDKGTLIIVARGVGGTGDVKLTKEKCYLTNLSIAVENIKKTIVNTTYLYYYFQMHNLRYLDSGSAQSQITISDLEKLEILLPPLKIQQKIASELKEYLYSNDTYKNIEEILYQQVSENLIVDWYKKDSIKSKIRLDITKVLQHQNYDKAQANEIAQKLLDEILKIYAGILSKE